MPKTPKSKEVPAVPVLSAEEELARIGAELALANLGDDERAFLAICQKLYRQSSGCNTPFEEFFRGIVLGVQYGHRLPTPDNIEHDLEEFRANFDDMKREASRFVEAYPEKETANA